MNSKNVLIMGTSPLVCEALTTLVEKIFQQINVFVSDNAQRGMQIVRENDIDGIILDTELKTSSSFDFVRRAKAGDFFGKVLFISNDDHSMVSQTAKLVGANGFISKTESTEMIKDAILAVSKGYSVFKEDLNQEKETVTLSKRESVVFSYLLKGYSNQKISELLSLSAKTISTYKTRILTKYNADSVIQIMNIQNMTLSTIMH
ncbi:response regulator transcription factor [Vibrio sp. VB16]|uniref:response regulator transcription factor n=1 Tax=Vibrio sp. VB16 TaxID=2785746 RepID=UPI00189D6EDC|nr:response regulator transcription factor [Vibrio sp. VB16]UGA54430.1 response regulator transcription factor [Vibrio sp. VB16]